MEEESKENVEMEARGRDRYDMKVQREKNQEQKNGDHWDTVKYTRRIYNLNTGIK